MVRVKIIVRVWREFFFPMKLSKLGVHSVTNANFIRSTFRYITEWRMRIRWSQSWIRAVVSYQCRRPILRSMCLLRGWVGVRQHPLESVRRRLFGRYWYLWLSEMLECDFGLASIHNGPVRSAMSADFGGTFGNRFCLCDRRVWKREIIVHGWLHLCGRCE